MDQYTLQHPIRHHGQPGGPSQRLLNVHEIGLATPWCSQRLEVDAVQLDWLPTALVLTFVRLRARPDDPNVTQLDMQVVGSLQIAHPVVVVEPHEHDLVSWVLASHMTQILIRPLPGSGETIYVDPCPNPVAAPLRDERLRERLLNLHHQYLLACAAVQFHRRRSMMESDAGSRGAHGAMTHALSDKLDELSTSIRALLETDANAT